VQLCRAKRGHHHELERIHVVRAFHHDESLRPDVVSRASTSGVPCADGSGMKPSEAPRLW
jgi:hypothetical protein